MDINTEFLIEANTPADKIKDSIDSLVIDCFSEWLAVKNIEGEISTDSTFKQIGVSKIELITLLMKVERLLPRRGYFPYEILEDDQNYLFDNGGGNLGNVLKFFRYQVGEEDRTIPDTVLLTPQRSQNTKTFPANRPSFWRKTADVLRKLVV